MRVLQHGVMLSFLNYYQNNDMECKFRCENELHWYRMGSERILTSDSLEPRVIEDTAIVPILIRNQKSQKIDNTFTYNLATFSVCKEMKH